MSKYQDLVDAFKSVYQDSISKMLDETPPASLRSLKDVEHVICRTYLLKPTYFEVTFSSGKKIKVHHDHVESFVRSYNTKVGKALLEKSET